MSEFSIEDLIVSSLLDIPAGTYGIASSEWHNNTRSDILYSPKLDIQKSLPPVLIEVQAIVDKKFILRLMQYTLNIINRYDSKPMVLVFCVGKVSPKSLLAHFTQGTCHQEHLWTFPSPVWARKCLFIFKNSYNDAAVRSPFEALEAISSFFCEKKATLFEHSHSEDSTIKLLYNIAKDVTAEEIQYGNNFQHTLDIILRNNEKCLNQIKKSLTVTADIKKTERLIEKGITYNTSIKIMLSDISTDPENDLEFPEELPVGIKRKTTTPKLEEEIAFIKKFKTNVGRMNWRQCLTKAHESNLFSRYSTRSSLRTNFSKHIKKTKN
ncbi:hypothetical protein HPULCUR_012080 [Helicostylum pulchrum]|uniref:Uncharacterized protein n=1 Tax=Helicostylum pulchrum TaxID=562976 RepID=A0ABP9YI65_9FUNG